MSAMQISNEIERIGDLSMSVIKLAKNITEKQDLMAKFKIAEIARAVETITIKTNLCFQTLEVSTILEIFVLNKNIKEKSGEAIQNIIKGMKSDSEIVVSGTNLILALKHLERVGEHCTNIAEYVYFMINAKTIKHDKNFDKK